MNHAHRVLDADELLARLLEVALRSTEARKYQSLLARDEVRAVELRRDVDGQAAAAQSPGRELRVGRGREEVSAEREEDLDAALVHRLDGLDGVEAVAARRLEVELAPGQLLLMTMRSHDQFNTTIYGLDDRYRGVMGERRVVFLNPEDVREQSLSAGQVVDLVSHFEGEERIARRFIVVPYKIPRRCAATYFPEANALVPVRSVADKSNTPASKSVVITLRPSDAPLRFDYDKADGR